MIGISVRDRPRLGIVHKPFSNFPSPGSGRTYIGGSEHGLYTVDNFTDQEGNSLQSPANYVPPFSRGKNICKETFRPIICGSHNKN